MKITEKSWVPLGSATLFVAAGIWVGGIQLKVAAGEAAVAAMDVKHEEAMKELRQVNKLLGEIVGRLDSLRIKR